MFPLGVGSSQLQLQVDALQDICSPREAQGRFVLSSAKRRLPEVEAGLSSGTPALKVKGKLFARVWEDGETLVMSASWLSTSPCSP